MITEELNLDLSGAQDQIDTLDAALTQVTQNFAVNLTEAIGTLDTVQVTADTSQAVSEIDALDALPPPPPIEIDADTSQAQSSIEDLGNSATDATGSAGGDGGGMEGLHKATEGFSAAAGLATGEAAGLGDAIGGINPAAAAGVAGVGILAASTADFFSKAVEADSASIRFQNTLGDFADTVEHLHVGNLNTDLSTLDTQLGSTEASTQAAAASIAQVGDASGTSQDKVAQITADITALTARAVALNPALGSIGDNELGLERALTRGGRFASQYGLDLSSAAINAQALAVAHEQGSNEVTFFDKVIAGSQISVQKYGDQLNQSIGQGLKNPETQLRAVETQLEETITTLGKPLVSPVLDLLKAGEPIAAEFAKVFAALDTIVVPIAEDVLQALDPIVTTIGDALVGELTAIAPAARDFADALGEDVKELQPIADGFANVISAGGPILSFLIEADAKVLKFAADTHLLTAGLLLIPGIGELAAFGEVFAGSQKKASDSTDKTSTAIFGQVSSLDELKSSYTALTNPIAHYIELQGELATPKVQDALHTMGLTTLQVSKDIEGGTQGLKDFVATGINAGNIKIKIDGVQQNADQVRGLNHDLVDLLNSGKAQITQGKDIVRAYTDTAAAANQQSDAIIRQLEFTGQITTAQVAAAESLVRAKDGTITYSAVLDELTNHMGAVNNELNGNSGQTASLLNNAAAWEGLATAVAQGKVATSDYQSIANKFGVTQAQVQTFAQSVTTGIDKLVTEASSKLPTADEAFSQLGKSTDPKALERNLNKQTEDIRNFSKAVQFIAASGLTDLSNFLIQEGPTASAGLIEALQKDGPKTAQALNDSLALNSQAKANITASYQSLIPEIAGKDGAITQLGEAGTQALGLSLDLSSPTTTQVQAMETQILQGVGPVGSAARTLGGSANSSLDDSLNFVPIVNRNAASAALALQHNEDLVTAATQTGIEVDRALADGLSLGLQTELDRVRASGQAIGGALKAAVNEELDSHSPSQEAVKIGQDFTAGLIIGLEPTGVAGAGQSLAGALTGAFTVPGFGASQAVASGLVGGAGTVVQVFVQPSEGMTTGQANALGNTIGSAAASKLPTARVKAVVRSA